MIVLFVNIDTTNITITEIMLMRIDRIVPDITPLAQISNISVEAVCSANKIE